MLGYSSYPKYLQSTHWKNVKYRMLKSKLVKRDSRGIPCCFFCERNDLPLHLHHKSYKSLGKEKLMHLELLCELCHSFVHALCNDYNLDLWKGTKKAGSIIQKKILTFKKIKTVSELSAYVNINFGHSQ